MSARDFGDLRTEFTHPPWSIDSRPRHMYSKLASLNSVTELGAMALSSPQTLRVVTRFD